MGQIKVLFPFKDGEEIWLGLDTPGLRRKVFRTVDKNLVNSEHIVAGLTVFEPGEVVGDAQPLRLRRGRYNHSRQWDPN